MGVMPTREAYGRALVKLGKTNDFFVLDADLSKATQTALFAREYPDRFFNMGIAEANMMTTAAGMASCGKSVFASSFAMFATGRAYEQVRNSIAYPNLPVIIGATHGGVMIGEDGASHQTVEDISLMRTLPNMTVLVPCDEEGTYAAVEAALALKAPCFVRTGRGVSKEVYETRPDFQIGKGIVLKDGSDLTILAIGDLVHEALEASKELETQGVSTAVVDMASVKPIDAELVKRYAEKTKRIITAEDHSILGGLGSSVCEIIAETGVGRVQRLGLNDTFGRSGSRNALQEYFNLNAKGILDCYKQF